MRLSDCAVAKPAGGFAARLLLLGTAVLVVALMAAGAARAQTSCEPGTLVGEDGQLNPDHPNAAKVFTALTRFGERLELLVPGDVDPRDALLTMAKVRELDGDLLESLLALMSTRELARFAPWVQPLNGDPGWPPSPNPPDWNGPTTVACILSGSYIDQAQQEMNKLLHHLYLMSEPGHDCPLNTKKEELGDKSLHDLCPNPGLIPLLDAGIARAVQANNWLNLAGDAYSDNQPCEASSYAHVAAIQASMGRWAIWGHYGGCGIALASEQFPGCEHEAAAAAILGTVSHLGTLAYQALWSCCDSQ